jgi:hypothetical protein
VDKRKFFKKHVFSDLTIVFFGPNHENGRRMTPWKGNEQGKPHQKPHFQSKNELEVPDLSF